jgi:hypothetical protein
MAHDGLRIHHIYQSCEPSYRVLAESSAEKARFRSCCGRVIPMLSFVLVFGAPKSPKKPRASKLFRRSDE